MFRPEKMSFISISILDKYMSQVLSCISKLGIIHIVDKNDLGSTTSELKDINTQPLKEEFAEISNRIEKLITIMGIESKSIDVSAFKDSHIIPIDPLQIAEKLENELSIIENEVNPLLEKRAQMQLEILDLEEKSHHLSHLDSEGLKIEDLRETRFLFFVFGDIPKEYYQRLVDSLSNALYILVPMKVRANRQEIMAFSLMSEKDTLSSALDAAYFTKVEIPKKYHGIIGDVLDEIEVEIWAKREEIAEIEEKLRSLKKSWRAKLQELYSTIVANGTVLESMEKFGKTRKTYFLAGWVPTRNIKGLQEELEILTNNGLSLTVGEPIMAYDADHHKPKVPTKLNHPAFLRPFTSLITNFGVPSYSGIDPTPIAALAFLAMFGIMFADVGHGIVLLILGLLGALYPFPQLKPIRNLSIFLACCGIASIIFGFVFGSIFGKEEIIRPLWFSLGNMNPNEVTRLLKFGVFFGVGILSIGVILNIIQSFRKRDYKEAIAGHWGIFSLISYWIMVFMLVTNIKFSWDKVLIIVVFMLPIVLKAPFSKMIGKKHQHSQEEAESIIESGFGIYEVV
ncbi:hypothetical protein FJZ33_05155, partial [Candidatus Poribacteria bacterium]|nr:hypothetical protein [Candidatus Poribacteria bacterium]